MQPQFRNAYLRGAEEAYRRLGGQKLFIYILSCDRGGLEIDSAEIELLIGDFNKPPPDPQRVYANLDEFAMAHPPEGWTIDPKTRVATQNA